MKLNSIRQATVRAAALGLCCVALATAPAARAEDKMTAQSLIDRQLTLDQITRYYYNFGKVDRQSEESFYAEDGELILGTRHYKGKEGIKQAYNRAPAAPPTGAAPASGAAPAVAAAPPRERTAFNVAIEESADHRARRHGHLAGHFHRVPAGEVGRSDEDDDSGKGVRHVGQGEWPVALQDSPDR